MHGGKRPGAGRRKGSLTKRTQEIVAKAAQEGLMPLDYMLSVLRDPQQSHDERLKAAINAAPYMHPRLSSVEHKGDPENPLETVTRIELTTPEGSDGQDRAPAETLAGIYGTG